MCGETAGENGGEDCQWAERAEGRSKLWAGRHDAYWAARTYRPGTQAIATDVCVPISRLAECVVETQKDIAETGLAGPIVGHIGDGNFHVLLLIDMDNAQQVMVDHDFLDRLVKRALAMAGTCTGEHGVGTGKMKYMKAEQGPGVEVMRAIKTALDPHHIFNTGKVV